jgi:hypothetical protein
LAKRSPQKGVLKKGSSKRGYSKGCALKGVLKRVLNQGTQSGVLTERRSSFGCVRPYFAGSLRTVHGRSGHPSVGFVRLGTVEYSRGTPEYSRVLKDTHLYSPRTAHPPFRSRANVTQYMAVSGTSPCSGTARVEQHRDTHTVLTGTPTVLRTPPRARHSFAFLLQCLWGA